MVKSKPITALFGGSFDPPHSGHKLIITKLLHMEDIEQIVVMPTYLNPFKSNSTATATKRLEWCKSVFTFSRVVISDYEALRNQPSYTVNTLKELNKEYNVKYIVIGSDNLKDITNWMEFGTINSQIEWIIFTRGAVNADLTAPLREYKVVTIKNQTSSTLIREGKMTDQVDNAIEDEVIKIYKKDKE